jgi:hypothetical protein
MSTSSSWRVADDCRPKIERGQLEVTVERADGAAIAGPL